MSFLIRNDCCDLPTPVGMARIGGQSWRNNRRSPHPRGDGPGLVGRRYCVCWISPPPWGWPGKLLLELMLILDLPTPVGMARI